jgi:hypothetical protein
MVSRMAPAPTPSPFTGTSFLQDPHARHLIEGTPLRLMTCTKRTRDIFSMILSLARLDGFWNGREAPPS